MKRTVDVRNLECPRPVIETQKALTQHREDEITVITNNPVAQENILRFLASQSIAPNLVTRGDGTYITFSGRNTSENDTLKTACARAAGKNMIISRNRIGDGAEELGTVLIRTFFHTLGELPEKPRRIFFVNSGVFLTTEGSPVLEDMAILEQSGTELLSCGTCLDYYKLKEKLKAGKTGSMHTMIEMINSGSIII